MSALHGTYSRSSLPLPLMLPICLYFFLVVCSVIAYRGITDELNKN